MTHKPSTKGQPLKGISTVSENHLFYTNPKNNSVKPPWYINCSRKEAEEILKKHREFGNVLIRPNSHFAVNGSYALSAVTTSSGESKYVHYVISRATNGFKLEVQSKPAPMACLKDVLDYYITAAGSQTHHALVIDPTETSNTKTLCREPIDAKKKDDYVNLPKQMTGLRTSAPDDGIYIAMSGNNSNTGACPNPSDLYINGKELDLDEPNGRDGHDYINVANVVPGRSASVRSPMSKSSSFPVSGREGHDDDDDDDDEYYPSPTCLAPPPPIFSDDIRPSSIHEPPSMTD